MQKLNLIPKTRIFLCHFDTRDKSGNNLGSQKRSNISFKIPIVPSWTMRLFPFISIHFSTVFTYTLIFATHLFSTTSFISSTSIFVVFRDVICATFRVGLAAFFLTTKTKSFILEVPFVVIIEVFLKVIWLAENKVMQTMYYKWLDMISFWYCL